MEFSEKMAYFWKSSGIDLCSLTKAKMQILDGDFHGVIDDYLHPVKKNNIEPEKVIQKAA